MFNFVASQVVAFNSEIEQLVTEYQASGFRISLVDQYTPFLSSFFADGVHPNNKAMYRLMADQWLPKILEAIHLKELEK